VSDARRAAVGLLLVLALSVAALAHAAAPPTWKSRMAAAERYAEGRAGTINFAVVDEAGRLHGYDARAIAPSASVLKAMLLVAYLRRDDVRNRPLEQWERDLLAPMIRRSDNAAATRMIGLVGEARLSALARAKRRWIPAPSTAISAFHRTASPVTTLPAAEATCMA